MSKRRPDPADRLRAALDARAAAEEAESDPWPGSDFDDDPPADGASAWPDEDDAMVPDDGRPPGQPSAGASVPSGRHEAPERGRRPRPAHADDPPPLVTWPVGLRDRFGTVSHPVVLTFLVLAIVAGGVFGFRVVNARAEARPVPVAAAPPELSLAAGSASMTGSSPAPSAGPSTGSGPATSVTEPRVIVHIVGQVAHPGVVVLPAGSRVEDAVEKAGGATRKADLSAVNLARLCVDGEQIRIPKPGEVATQPGSAPPDGPPNGGATSPGGAGGKVSLNTADAAALDTLPGVGPVLAQRILDWRAEHGRFSSIDELGEVSGIGEKLLAQLAGLVSL